MRRIAYLFLGVLAAVVLAVGYFDTRRIFRETDDARDVAPPRGSFVHADDAEVFVQQAGQENARAVVLLHGTGTWSEVWRETIDALAPNYHVVAIDLPPFGYSSKLRGSDSYTPERQARRILGVLDALHIERATLVAHSVGGRPAVAVALAAPARIDRLILVDPALGFDSAPPAGIVSRLFGTPLLRNAVLSTYGTNPLFLRPLFRSFVSNPSAVTDARLSMIREPMSIAGTTNAYGDWLQCLMDSPGVDLRRVAQLRMPVRLLWGRTDSVTPLWQGRSLHKTIAGSRLTIIDGVGHIPYIEDVERFNGALKMSLE